MTPCIETVSTPPYLECTRSLLSLHHQDIQVNCFKGRMPRPQSRCLAVQVSDTCTVAIAQCMLACYVMPVMSFIHMWQPHPLNGRHCHTHTHTSLEEDYGCLFMPIFFLGVLFQKKKTRGPRARNALGPSGLNWILPSTQDINIDLVSYKFVVVPLATHLLFN